MIHRRDKPTTKKASAVTVHAIDDPSFSYSSTIDDSGFMVEARRQQIAREKAQAIFIFKSGGNQSRLLQEILKLKI